MFNRSRAFIISVGVLLCLTACSIYQAASITGGYSDNYMGNDVYKVYYKGNSAIDFDSAKNYALLRAAHLTIKSHKRYFEVISIENVSKQYQTYSPPTNASPGIYNENTAPATITSYSGTIVTHTDPEVLIVIKMLDSPSAVAYDANALLAKKQG